MRGALILLMLAASVARADEVPKIEVAVGAKAQRDVAIATGYLCDDPTLISVEMRTESQTSNLFIVTGIKEGKTLCRVGTSHDRVHFIFQIDVVPAKTKAPAKPKPKPNEPEPPSAPPIDIQP